MTLLRQHEALITPITMHLSVWSKMRSSAPTSCRRATLALIFATPRLFPNTPSCHPIRVSGNAIIRLRCGCATNLTRAALAMDFAAPRFLANRPTHLPIGKAISAIVRVCRPGWCNRSNRNHWHHRRRLGNHDRRWSCWWASLVVHLAAPSLLASTPL